MQIWSAKRFCKHVNLPQDLRQTLKIFNFFYLKHTTGLGMGIVIFMKDRYLGLPTVVSAKDLKGGMVVCSRLLVKMFQ